MFFQSFAKCMFAFSASGGEWARLVHPAGRVADSNAVS